MQQLSSAQVSPEIPINENFESVAVASYFGKKQPTTTGLTWGGYGGQYAGNVVADWTVTLTDNATNYVVVNRSSGAVSVATSTTNWNSSTYARVYKVTTVSGAVSAEVDSRLDTNGLYNPNAGGGTAGTLDFDPDGTLTANSDTKIPTQKAVKTYADAKLAGLSWKTAVRAASTGNGTLASAFENGDTLDGVTLATGDRILLKNQTAPAENGIYVVAASGAPTRATDADSSPELVDASVMVSEGTTLADTQWVCSTNAPITVGSTSLTWVQFNAGAVSDGDKGDITVSSSGTTWTVDNDAISYAKMQNVSATARLLARKTAGSGDIEEATLSEILDFIGSAARGDILYRGSSSWSRLAGGTLGKVLTTRSSSADPTWEFPLQVIPMAVGDRTTAITAGTNKLTFRNPYATAFNVTDVVGALETAQASGNIFTVDINEAGTTILSTKLTIDNTETIGGSNAGAGSATPAVISDASIAAFAVCSIDVDQIGNGSAAGLQIYLIGWLSPP